MSDETHSDVIVVGAGAAGLSATVALAESGGRVTLLERKPYVGGRAYSYPHPALEEVVDSQHVLLGCCTNLIDLCEKAGTSDNIRWYDTQTFLEPNGRASTISTSTLPAPFHFAPSLASAKMLGVEDKLAMAEGLTEFVRGYPSDDSESVAQWLKRTRQTERAIHHFWRPIILATLNDNAENCSTRYAGQVFHELFVKNSTGGRLGIPTVPLSEFYAGIAQYAEQLGATLKPRASVESLHREPGGRWCVQTADGTAYSADAVVLAIPFEQMQKLLPAIELNADEAAIGSSLEAKMSRFIHSPFTSILLWYDREISNLDHAWLLDTTIEWFFHKSRIRRYAPERGSYVELVIAGSRTQLHMTREEIMSAALTEFEVFFPEAKKATLIKSGILKTRATFSIVPGLEKDRPAQETGVAGLYLAGDWTRTAWPSTMEGAARSGRLAAEAITGTKFLSPDLPVSGLMKFLAKRSQS